MNRITLLLHVQEKKVVLTKHTLFKKYISEIPSLNYLPDIKDPSFLLTIYREPLKLTS